LGDGSTVDKSTAVQIGTATNWVYVSAGTASSFAISNDGKLWGWGLTNFSVLGDGTPIQRNAPVLPQPK